MTTSRRSLMNGVVWATPVAAVAVAAPAFAASGPIAVSGCGSAWVNVPLVPQPTEESPDPEPEETSTDVLFYADAPTVTSTNGGVIEVSALQVEFAIPLVGGFLIPDVISSGSADWTDLTKGGTSTINGAPAAIYRAAYLGVYSIAGSVATAQPGEWKADWKQMQLPRESLPDGDIAGEAHLTASSVSGASAKSEACGAVTVRELPKRG